MIMRKKTHERKTEVVTKYFRKVVTDQQDIIDDQRKLIEEYEKRWLSTDGKMVLRDLDEALKLIVEYQRSLDVLAAPDPYETPANGLLAKWGIPHWVPVRGGEGLDKYAKGAYKTWGPDGIDTVQAFVVGDALRFVPKPEPLCEHCKGPLDDRSDSNFKMIGSYEDISTGKKEQICAGCWEKSAEDLVNDG